MVVHTFCVLHSKWEPERISPAAREFLPCRAERISRLRRERISFCFAKTDEARRTLVLRASFTLAAIYSRGTCRPTTIDVLMFHFRVRNGTGWGHQAMTTRLLPYFVLRTLYFVLQFVWQSSALAGCCVVCWLPFRRQAGIRVACFVRFL